MRYILILLICAIFLYSNEPKLFLLKVYKEDMNITNWLMSEKLDGIRAFWDGEKLLTKKGNPINAPKWFTKDFPDFELDGELWSKRGDFENISSIVRRENPDKRWEQISYNIFEVPKQKGGLLKRLDVLKEYLESKPNRYIKIIPQNICKDKNHLDSFLEEVLSKKGEGVVLRKANISYEEGRTKNALKVKKYLDDECIIDSYNYKNKRLSSINCKWRDMVIKIGSGIDNNFRKNPLKLGVQITFKYYGLTKNGIPKYSSYLRVRE